MRLALAASAIALTTIMAVAAHAQPGNPTVGLFAQDAAIANEFEIAESKIILEDSKNPALRAFARDMVREHTAAQRKLANAGRMAGVPTAFVFDAGRQKAVNDIGLMEGDTLDSTYVTDQVAAHANAAANLAGYAQDGSDPALRAYARDALRTVQHHQRMLEQMTGQPSPL